MDTKASMLAAVLALAAKGRKVFPIYTPIGAGCSCGDSDCGSPGKHPRTDHGFKDATTDQAKIREWWTKWPDANIGTPTGRGAGIMVVDIDPRHGGTDSFYQLQEEHGRIPDTLHTRTGGGGDHFIFKYPTGANVRSLAGLRPGIDIKADDGYILLPPSRHVSGERYSWILKSAIAEAPDWLVRVIGEHAPKTDPAQPGEKIRAGERNNFLTRVAGSMRRQAADQKSIEAALLVTNATQCDPPLAEVEVKRIAASVGRYAPAEQEAAPALKVCSMGDVQAVAVSWLWHPYVPLGKVTAIEGDPGLGKSWLLLAIAAAQSRGWALPGGNPTAPARVVLMSAEDGLADTIRPRLDALNADCRMITAVTDRFTLDKAGCLALDKVIAEIRPALVIIDPLFAYTGAGVDIHKANETRAILSRLAAIADQYQCAIVFLRHLTKSGRDKSIYRGVGSIDITAACRSVLLVGADPDDKENRAVCHVKSNLAPCGASIGYTLKDGIFIWTGETSLTAARILAPEDEDEAASKDGAKEFLEDMLSGGPVLSSKILERWHGSQRTLYRAKKDLKIESTHNGVYSGPWYWYLPARDDQATKVDCQNPEVGNLRGRGGEHRKVGNLRSSSDCKLLIEKSLPRTLPNPENWQSTRPSESGSSRRLPTEILPSRARGR